MKAGHWVIALAVLALLAPAPAAAEPHLSDLKTALEGRKVMISFRLTDGFDSELRERIQSGLPTGIVYDMQLFKDRLHWWDRGIAESSLQVVAMFNAVTREYLVNFKLDGRLIESRQLRDLDELEEALTHVEALPVFDLAPMPADWKLLIAVRAELGSGTMLAFIPTHLRTDWKESRKFRPPAD
ncbi:MAG: DUF4390 domain-containing protein [Acidobacteriota bacterium]